MKRFWLIHDFHDKVIVTVDSNNVVLDINMIYLGTDTGMAMPNIMGFGKFEKVPVIKWQAQPKFREAVAKLTGSNWNEFKDKVKGFWKSWNELPN